MICWISDLYPCLVFIGMFQVPADQKETDLVGRTIVHKSAYKQATGNFNVCHNKNKLYFIFKCNSCCFIIYAHEYFKNIYMGFDVHVI